MIKNNNSSHSFIQLLNTRILYLTPRDQINLCEEKLYFLIMYFRLSLITFTEY